MTDSLRDQVVSQLLAYEPDYARLVGLGDRIGPVLAELVAGDDARLSERAVVLALHLGGETAQILATKAAADPRERVRAALAAYSHLLPPPLAEAMVEQLLHDPTAGIRRIAVDTAARSSLRSLTDRINGLAEGDPETVVRDAAKRATEQLQNR